MKSLTLDQTQTRRLISMALQEKYCRLPDNRGYVMLIESVSGCDWYNVSSRDILECYFRVQYEKRHGQRLNLEAFPAMLKYLHPLLSSIAKPLPSGVVLSENSGMNWRVAARYPEIGWQTAREVYVR